MSIKYYIIDTETSGLSARPDMHEVVQISIIRCSDKVQLSKNIIAERPERASYDALRITGKTLADLKKGDRKEDVVALCNKFFEEDGGTPASRCIIGHNIIAFDKKFLHALWESCDQEFPANLYMDTLLMMKAWAKTQGLVKPKLNLDASCDLFGFKKVGQAHTAKGDTQNNFLLYKELLASGFDYLPFVKTHPHKIERVSDTDVDNMLNELGMDFSSEYEDT
jgi:DNA polymerase III epsilon subunit-like protein